MNRWLDYVKENLDNSMQIRYEELKGDTVGGLQKIIDFLNTDMPVEILKKSSELGSFQKMQKLESLGGGGNPWLIPGDSNNLKSFKVRKGEIGEYKEFFLPEHIEFLNRYLKDNLHPDFGYDI